MMPRGSTMRLRHVIGCLAVTNLAVTHAYDDFRVGVPNGARLSAQGHGAWFGDDNPFGLDWAMFDYTWSLELCASDSDMDGQHNGFELGDECCCWDAKTAWALAVAPSFRGGKARTGHAESYAKHGIEDLPRGDLLSHPGDPTSTSPAARRVRGVGEGCEALCARVAAGADRALAASKRERPARFGALDVATVPALQLLLGLSLGLAAAALLIPSVGAAKHARNLGPLGLARLVALAAAYDDVAGLLLHVVLDHHSAIDAAHHLAPTKLAAAPAAKFLFARLAPAAAVVWATLAGLLLLARVRGGAFDASRAAPTALFVYVAGSAGALSQFAHRWAHAPSWTSPAWVRCLAAAGLVLSPRTHGLHHVAPHGSHFSTSLGYADAIADPALEAIPAASRVWVVVCGLWLLLPAVLASPRATAAAHRARTAACERLERVRGTPPDGGDAARGAALAAAGLLVLGHAEDWARGAAVPWQPLGAAVGAFCFLPRFAVPRRGAAAGRHLAAALACFAAGEACAAVQRRARYLPQPLGDPLERPDAVLGAAAVAGLALRGLGDVLGLELRRADAALVVLAALAALTAAARGRSASPALALGFYAGVAATFDVLAAARPADGPMAADREGLLSPD